MPARITIDARGLETQIQSDIIVEDEMKRQERLSSV